MQHQTIRSALLDLIRSGDLTFDGGQFYFMGEPLSEGDTSDYRTDGWSYETSHGCRRHRAIDEYIEKLANGDEFERQVANNKADSWFCFDPRALGIDFGMTADDVHHIEAEDEAERNVARRAAFLARIRAAFLMGGGRDFDRAESFAMDNDTGDDGRGDHRVIADHRVVFAGVEPKQKIIERWPEEYIQHLESLVEARRKAAESGVDWD